MPEEKMARLLIDEIDKEIQKPFDEQDMRYIDECSDMIDKIGIKNTPSAEIKNRELQKLFCAFDEEHASHMRSKHRSGRLRKGAAVILAAIFMCFSPVLIAAAVDGISPIAVIQKWGHGMFDLPHGEPIEYGGITFIRNGDVKEYDSVEALLKDENIDILYPSYLPADAEIKSIYQIDSAKGKELHFSISGGVYYSVCLYDAYGGSIYNLSSDEDVTIDGITFYFTEVNGKKEVIFVHNGNSYSIAASDKATLLDIINGLKTDQI